MIGMFVGSLHHISKVERSLLHSLSCGDSMQSVQCGLHESSAAAMSASHTCTSFLLGKASALPLHPPPPTLPRPISRETLTLKRHTLDAF